MTKQRDVDKLWVGFTYEECFSKTLQSKNTTTANESVTELISVSSNYQVDSKYGQTGVY